MITTAAILAGGLGTRLKEKTQDHPKGFVVIQGISLFERSLQHLLSCGITKIYIGTGYLSEAYEQFAKDKPFIEWIKNDRFFETSSMHTLYGLKDKLCDDFLLLESDLLYESRALNELLTDPRRDLILGSGTTNSGDEVYIDATSEGILKRMSKQKEDLSSVYAELVGISKVSQQRFGMMNQAYATQTNQKIDYEHVMSLTSPVAPFFCKKIEDLVWCEIDDQNHFERAKRLILPKLEEANKISPKPSLK